MSHCYDAVLVVSFGGPEAADEVLPFLENVLRGKNVPRERMLAVAEHYAHFGGRSPINDQNRVLAAAIEADLAAHGRPLPVFWGNRNWHPLLADTLAEMGRHGVRRAPGAGDECLQLVLESAGNTWKTSPTHSGKSAGRRPKFISCERSSIIPASLPPRSIGCARPGSRFRRRAAARRVDLHGPQHSAGHGRRL